MGRDRSWVLKQLYASQFKTRFRVHLPHSPHFPDRKRGNLSYWVFIQICPGVINHHPSSQVDIQWQAGSIPENTSLIISPSYLQWKTRQWLPWLRHWLTDGLTDCLSLQSLHLVGNRIVSGYFDCFRLMNCDWHIQMSSGGGVIPTRIDPLIIGEDKDSIKLRERVSVWSEDDKHESISFNWLQGWCSSAFIRNFPAQMIQLPFRANRGWSE